jgi:hypothetical protein
MLVSFLVLSIFQIKSLSILERDELDANSHRHRQLLLQPESTAADAPGALAANPSRNFDCESLMNVPKV